ncbi:MAG: hypothetical protein RLZZ558_1851 [Planctomycetota bacterium]|jgi:hypothetical protein
MITRSQKAFPSGLQEKFQNELLKTEAPTQTQFAFLSLLTSLLRSEFLP